MKRQLYQYAGTRIAGIVIILLLLTGSSYAQTEQPPDSTAYVEEVTDTLAEITDDDVVDEEKETNYFQEKWMAGAGIDSLYLRQLSDSVRMRMQQDKDFWYANTPFEAQKQKRKTGTADTGSEKDHGADTGPEPEPESRSSGAFESLLWLFIIGGFIAFLVIYLSNSNIRLFRRSRSIPEEEVDTETADIFTIPYQKEIDKAISAGNYRLAIRLLYLRLLLRLSEKNVIQYTADKTNFDYLLQLQGTSWYQPFFRLTRHYEYVWYGWFDIDREKFDVIQTEFKTLEQQV